MANNSRALAGIYTLTPLHMGTGQAAGAVDLPVAREHHTGLPVIPATAVKGVWRDIFEQAAMSKPNNVDSETIRNLFGPELEGNDGTAQEGQAGGLIFTEGQCVAIPFRSASKPLLYCTSLMVLERLARNLRAFHLAGALNIEKFIQKLEDDRVYVTEQQHNGKTLLVEDMLFKPEEVFFPSQQKA